MVSPETASASGLWVVTGAFGYSGKYITRRLLAAGARVRTLTNSPNRPHAFGAAVEAHPYHFDDPRALERSLRGADVLINTYWGVQTTICGAESRGAWPCGSAKAA